MVGDQIWMTQNLAYLPIVCPLDWESDSQELYYIYGYVGTDVNQARLSSNYNKYGVLYNWPAAKRNCENRQNRSDHVRSIRELIQARNS